MLLITQNLILMDSFLRSNDEGGLKITKRKTGASREKS